MKPRSDADAPSVDPGALARLKRLDPSLVVTWNAHAIDELNGCVILHQGKPILQPQFHLWRKDDVNSDHYWVNSYWEFGLRQVLGLERDLARFVRPQDIVKKITDARHIERVKQMVSKQQLQRDKIDENKSRIRDLVFNEKTSRRDGKIFSGGGVHRRGGAGTVEKDAREDGWVLPEGPTGSEQ